MFTYVIWYNNYSGDMPASSADSVKFEYKVGGGKQRGDMPEKTALQTC